MLTRVERKLAEIQRWVDSVDGVADWPAAIALSVFRTRPPAGNDVVSRWIRRLVPAILVRPARLCGWSVRLNPGDLAQYVIYEEMFIEGAYDLSLVAFVPDAIVDCGAFEGYFSLLAAVRYPGVPVTAFEPNARNRAGLSSNVARNAAPVAVRAEAVSTHDGSANFVGGGCGGELGAPGADAVLVPVVDLRGVIAGLRCERLLLKMDIEGEESLLLPALLPMLPRACAIFFEWHHGADAFERMSGMLAANGFQTQTIHLKTLGGTLFIDAFAQRH